MITDGKKNVTVNEMEDLAERAANKALAGFFNLIDVDVDDPASIRALRDNLAWAGKTRESTAKVKSWALAGAGSMILLGVSFFCWQAFEIFRAGWQTVK